MSVLLQKVQIVIMDIQASHFETLLGQGYGIAAVTDA